MGRWIHRGWRTAALAVLAGMLAGSLADCGLITAGISVPEAFTHNGDLGLKGTITDDRGEPMDAVRMTVKREYYLWHADASYPEFDTTTLTENHAFDIPTRRAHELTFTFRQSGYVDQTIVVDQDAIRGDFMWVEGSGWPLNTPVRVILQKADRQPPPLRWLAAEVDYTDPEKNPVIDLARLLPVSADPGFGWSRQRTVELSKDAVRTLPQGEPVPADCLYAVVERQPTKMSGPDQHFDPLDLNLPAHLALHISGSGVGDGFVPAMPMAGSSPLRQMLEAPAEGYAQTLDFTDQRLRQLRNPAHAMVGERNEFFYLHAHGMFGKGVISWSRSGIADQNGPLRLFVVVMFQPDASRSLALRNGM